MFYKQGDLLATEPREEGKEEGGGARPSENIIINTRLRKHVLAEKK